MKRILIADDSPVVTGALSAALSCDYEVHTCDDPADILSLLESLQPDAILVDISLIGITGLLQIGKSAFRPTVLLVLTNIITDQLLQTAQAIDASYILLIPFSVRSLLDKLEDLLRT